MDTTMQVGRVEFGAKDVMLLRESLRKAIQARDLLREIVEAWERYGEGEEWPMIYDPLYLEEKIKAACEFLAESS